VAGDKDHGPDEHDYPLWQRRWSALLGADKTLEVGTAHGWPSDDDFKTADVLVWYSANPFWAPDKAKQFDEFFARGGGMVFLHYAVNAPRGAAELAERIGLAWSGGQARFRHGALDLAFNRELKHPIVRNFEKAHFVDESYWQLVGDERKVQVLASGVEEGRARPLLWTHEPGKGRVFVSILGHYTWTFDDPLFRVLFLRGIAWTAREPVDRFNALVTVGARVRD
jgi:type 1 glutamine amidotransferase